VRRALGQAFVKLDPRVMVRNPVMFTVEIGSVVTTVEFFGRPDLFVGLVALWLWATVLFANFAEAVAEGRGQAQADTLRRSRKETFAGARVHARTRATLDTAGPTFVAFLLGVIVIVGGLIYFPMLILGPIGERFVG
jgi:potassium-transporting ATPase ATP-binding subunit